MPGPATFFSLGAVGAAAVYATNSRRRNSQTSSDDPSTPFTLARRRSSTVQPDHEWVARKQPEYVWRRDNGVSFSHNSAPKFPLSQQQQRRASNTEQISSTR
ncbi:MAG: hypothetical protein EXX96DRAFT_565332 [Benjaminiella poitrasii]|nr:MAG: hypothetical protein EXX96DRAFT_565332 [Benjaminiella poitrasii]